MSSSPFFTTTPVANNAVEIPGIELERLDVDVEKRDKPKDPDLIAEILEIYEGEYNIFKNLGPACDGKKILERINKFLYPVLNINLGTLFKYDFNSFMMVVSAFYGKDTAVVDTQNTNLLPWARNIFETSSQGKDLLDDCHHPLHTLMLMCLAADSMQHALLKDDFGQEVRIDQYKKLKIKQEDLACELINYVYQKDCDVARLALEVDYQSQFELGDVEFPVKPANYLQYLKGRFDHSKEIMAIAYEAKAMKFLSQKPCLNLMRIRKDCRDLDSEVCKRHTMAKSFMAKPKKPDRHFALKMKEKLWIHMALRICYVLSFAFMLCRYPNYDDYEKKNPTIIIPFCYVLLVLLAQFSMTAFKLRDYVKFQKEYGPLPKTEFFSRPTLNLCHQYFAMNLLAFYRMIMIMSLLLLETFRFFCYYLRPKNTVKDANFWHSYWTIIPISLEVLYCTLFAIAAISSLRLFHSFFELGFFVHLMKKMLKTVGMFVLIFLAFWFVLAVIHVSISRTLSNPKGTIFYTVISEGKFEIFGEVRDEDRNGILAGCDSFNRTVFDISDMNYAEASCLFRGSIIPFLVFTYMFVAGVLLVNLLTAQLTKEYEEESESSKYYVGYLQYEQLSKIESKLYLPPPFSLIYVLFRFFCLCFSCMFPLVKLFEGNAWGSVRKDARSRMDLSETKIKKFLETGPESAWKKLRDMIQEYDREEENSKNLRKLRDELVKFLEARTEAHETRLTTRSRGPTALDSRQENRGNEMTTVSSAVFTSFDDDPAREGIVPC